MTLFVVLCRVLSRFPARAGDDIGSVAVSSNQYSLISPVRRELADNFTISLPFLYRVSVFVIWFNRGIYGIRERPAIRTVGHPTWCASRCSARGRVHSGRDGKLYHFFTEFDRFLRRNHEWRDELGLERRRFAPFCTFLPSIAPALARARKCNARGRDRLKPGLRTRPKHVALP
jgi:hypothetical protein